MISKGARLKFMLLGGLIILAVVLALCAQRTDDITTPTPINSGKTPVTHPTELKISDFPEAFNNNTLIVVGDNFSEIEVNAANQVATYLTNVTGNAPIIKKVSEVSNEDKRSYNLIVVGFRSNNMIKEVYEVADVAFMNNLSGESGWFLEILNNPWSEGKKLLVVYGNNGENLDDGIIALLKVGSIIGKKQLSTERYKDFLNKVSSLVLDKSLSRSPNENVSLYIWFDEKPTEDELQKLRDLKVSIDKNKWVPPVGSHPYGFIPATVKVSSLYNVAQLEHVKRITSAEKPTKVDSQQEDIASHEAHEEISSGESI